MAGTGSPITTVEAARRVEDALQMVHWYKAIRITFDPKKYGVVAFGSARDTGMSLHHRSCPARKGGKECTC